MHIAFRRLSSAAALAMLLSTSIFAADGPGSMDCATLAKLKTVLTGAQRGDANKARDQYRHPLEILRFFGFKQDMAVMEVWPGGGWWTEILAPLLKEKGQYFAASEEFVASFQDKLDKDPASYGKAKVVAISPSTGKAEPVKPGSMDMVLTFRNIHNWMDAGDAKEMFEVMFKSLKPGGYLGVEEHRGRTDKEQDPKAANGYVREDYAIKLIESAGFKWVATSPIGNNPKDTKDYPEGVWTLPPTLAEGDKDRAKYVAIGEADNFTLLFRRPAS